jgi:hypothetical protein
MLLPGTYISPESVLVSNIVFSKRSTCFGRRSATPPTDTVKTDRASAKHNSGLRQRAGLRAAPENAAL